MKITLVPPALAIHEVTETTFDNPGAQENEPIKGDTNCQNQARDAVDIPQVSSFEIETMAFHSPYISSTHILKA